RMHRLQFGFRRKHSTVDAMLYLQSRIFKAFKSRKHLTVAFLDIAKAFDTTWHAGLLHKLYKIGITGHAWRWCQAFLSGRKIRTVSDPACSDWFDISAGVPQGSVLSPFLFLIYINDIADECPGIAEVLLFADDIAVLPKLDDHPGDVKLFHTLLAFETWSERWRLRFSPKKCKVLCFSVKKKRPANLPPYHLHLEYLERVKHFDYLGLRWQENGKWHEHLEKVCKSANKVSRMICTLLRHECRPKFAIIRQLCQALIRTKFAYGMPVWKPPRLSGWTRMDTIIMEPMRRTL